MILVREIVLRRGEPLVRGLAVPIRRLPGAVAGGVVSCDAAAAAIVSGVRWGKEQGQCDVALIMNEPPQARLSEAELAPWRDIAPATVADELNRAGAMSGAIKPVAQGMAFAGQAITVQTMVGDNSALHYALTVAWPGAVLVVDARGHADTAVWGAVMMASARQRGVAGVVIDGAVRDLAELRQSSIAVFARGAAPGGPHKGWGGSVNAPIQCAGVPVGPGDLVIGDDDGVVVVGLGAMEGLLERCKTRIARERATLERIAAGVSTVEALGMPPADEIG